MANQGGLLDFLTEQMGCDYLSDLRCRVDRMALAELVKNQLHPDDYTLREWQEAASYLLNRRMEGSTAESLYQALVEGLCQPADEER